MTTRVLRGQLALMFLMADIYSNTYTGEASKAQLDAMTKSKNADFTATLTWYEAEKVGTGPGKDNAGNDNEYFILRPRTVRPDYLEDDLKRFQRSIQKGIAFAGNTLPTTTTTTAAP